MKIDVIHIAICVLLTEKNYYKFSYIDEDGWPHFENINPLPSYTVLEQTILLKKLILAYFDKIFNLV